MQTVQNFEDHWNEAKLVKDFTEGENPRISIWQQETTLSSASENISHSLSHDSCYLCIDKLHLVLCVYVNWSSLCSTCLSSVTSFVYNVFFWQCVMLESRSFFVFFWQCDDQDVFWQIDSRVLGLIYVWHS